MTNHFEFQMHFTLFPQILSFLADVVITDIEKLINKVKKSRQHKNILFEISNTFTYHWLK